MNYFPLLKSPGFKGVTTLANFAPDVRGKNRVSEVFAYALHSTGAQWKLDELGRIKPYQFLKVSTDDFQEQMQSNRFLFMSAHRIRENSWERLPKPSSFQSSRPSWRANLAIGTKTAFTSYQGDYPDEMTAIKRGSLLSISPMFQDFSRFQNRVIFFNLRRDPSIEEKSIHVSDIETGKVLQTISVKTNAINSFEVQIPKHYFQKSVYLYSCEIAGIPLYFSASQDGRQLSIEHTHPPVEYLVFGNRYKNVRNMKEWWFQHAQHN